MSSIKVELTAEEYVAAFQYQSGFKVPPTGSFYFLLALCIVAAIFGSFTLAQRGAPAFFGIGPAALFAGILLFGYILLPRRARVLYNQQRELHEPMQIEITPDTIRFHSSFGSSTRPWGSFLKWAETPHNFLLYQSDALLNVIPKKALTEPNGQSGIRSYLHQAGVRETKAADAPRVLSFLMLLWIANIFCIYLGVY
jgi:hypothetical protein